MVMSRTCRPSAASCSRVRRGRRSGAPRMCVTWSQVALPDDSHWALYSLGNETHGVRTVGAAGRNARTRDGVYGGRTEGPQGREAGLTHMILVVDDWLCGARRRTPASEVVRPNWLFAGGFVAKLEYATTQPVRRLKLHAGTCLNSPTVTLPPIRSAETSWRRTDGLGSTSCLSSLI